MKSYMVKNFKDADINIIIDIWELIKKAKNITLLTRKKPYGDSIAACAVMEQFLEKLGKNVEVISGKLSEVFPIKLKNWFILEYQQIPDLIISLDTLHPEDLYFTQEFKDIPFVNIDHHEANDIEADKQLIVLNVSSSCELLYDLLRKWDESLVDDKMAKIVLFGIIADSDVLRSDHVYPGTFAIIADITKRGIDFMSLRQAYLDMKKEK